MTTAADASDANEATKKRSSSLFFFTLELASKDFSKKFIVTVASAAAKNFKKKVFRIDC